MDYRKELLVEIGRLHSIVESAIRDRSSYREGEYFYELECAVQELNCEYPEEGVNIEDIKKQLEELRSCPELESTD